MKTHKWADIKRPTPEVDIDDVSIVAEGDGFRLSAWATTSNLHSIAYGLLAYSYLMDDSGRPLDDEREKDVPA